VGRESPRVAFRLEWNLRSTVVWIYLGGYWNFFRTDLDSFWAFDEAGRLIDVKTRRMSDAL
jgi:hypothetical protein